LFTHAKNKENIPIKGNRKKGLGGNDMFEYGAPHILWRTLLAKTKSRPWQFDNHGHQFLITRKKETIVINIDQSLTITAVSPSLLLMSALQQCDFVNNGQDVVNVVMKGRSLIESVAYRKLWQLIPTREQRKEATESRSRISMMSELLKNRIDHMQKGDTLARRLGKSQITIKRERKEVFSIETNLGIKLMFRNLPSCIDSLARACCEPLPVYVQDLLVYSACLIKIDEKWVETHVHLKQSEEFARCLINAENPALFLLVGHYKP